MSTKNVMLFIMIGIFMISFASAFSIDNVKEYDINTRSATAVNAFGFGANIATSQLLTPKYNIVAPGYGKVASFKITGFQDYNDILQDVELFDMTDDMNEFYRDYDYKYLTYETIGDHKEKWIDLENYDITDGEEITIGIFTIVEAGDIVEWIPNMFGIRIEEWAVWTSPLNLGMIAYYEMNEGTGDLIDSIGRSGNLTETVTPVENVSGLLGSARGPFTTTKFFRNATALPQNINETDDYSFSLWIYPETTLTTTERMFGLGGFDTYDYQVMVAHSSSDADNTVRIHASTFGVALTDSYILTTSALTVDSWNHIALTYDGITHNATAYLNGVIQETTIAATILPPSSSSSLAIGIRESISSPFLSGYIDEVGVWNRTILNSEVVSVYNSGDGIEFNKDDFAPTVTAISPANNEIYNVTAINFTCYGKDDTNFTEMRLNINGAVNETNSSGFNATNYYFNLTLPDATYNWSCSGEDNSSQTATTTLRFLTVSSEGVTYIDESYVETTTEGSTELFSVNVTKTPDKRFEKAFLYYNGTPFTTSIVEYDTNNYYITSNKVIPSVSTDTNITFYWGVTLEGGGEIKSTSHNQTVKDLDIDDCSGFSNVIFNMTLVSEGAQTLIPAVGENTSIKINLQIANRDNSLVIVNYTHDFDEVNPASICSEDNLGSGNFRLDALIEYKADDRFSEFYNIQNYNLTNITTEQNITLYNLNSSVGQEYKITYKDEQFNTVPGAVIQIQRYYIDEGAYKTVEIPLISTSGYTIAHLVSNSVIYNLVILKDGVVLDSFNNVIADCQNPTFTECVINLNSFSTGVSPYDFSTDGDFTSIISYNETSREVSTTFAIISGVSALTELNVTLWNAYSNTTVCSDTLDSAGGTLTCTIPVNYKNSTIIVEVTSDGDQKRYSIIKLGEDPSNIYGNNLVFVALMIILFIIGMSITDEPSFLGIMLIFGSIILITLNVVQGTGWIGAGATILWFIIAVVILLIKGGNRN